MSKDILADRVTALEEKFFLFAKKVSSAQEQLEALLKMSDKLRKALPHVNFEDPA